MSGLRRSTRATTSTINVKLNEQNEIEYFKVENEVDDDDDDDGEYIIPDQLELDNDEIDEEIVDEEEEEEEELIANADGTMTIKMPDKKKRKKAIPLHHICTKCSKVLSSGAVSLCMRFFFSPIID